MLITTLAIGDSIRLVLPDGQPVRLIYCGPNRNWRDSVRLGVDADRGVKVYREEMLPVKKEKGQ